jgi:hypothetical protein
MAIAEEKDRKYSLVQASLKKLTAAHADFIDWKVNKRLANVEQVGALAAKTVEEQLAQLQQMKSEHADIVADNVALKQKVILFAQEVEEKDGRIKRLANVEQVGALAGKTVEEQLAQPQQMKSEHDDVVADNVALKQKVTLFAQEVEEKDLENKEWLQTAEEKLKVCINPLSYMYTHMHTHMYIYKPPFSPYLYIHVQEE